MEQKHTALLSAFKKDRALLDFAEGLVGLDWDLLASGGTRKYLTQSGLPCQDTADIVGGAILDHRVVTLSRELHAGLLARRDVESDMNELSALNIKPIDLVYVDLYPLAEAILKPDSNFRSVREMIDIGGPAMLRSAAKGGQLSVSDPDQFERVLKFIAKPPENTPTGIKYSHAFMSELWAAAERKAKKMSELAERFYQANSDGLSPAEWRNHLV